MRALPEHDRSSHPAIPSRSSRRRAAIAAHGGPCYLRLGQGGRARGARARRRVQTRAGHPGARRDATSRSSPPAGSWRRGRTLARSARRRGASPRASSACTPLKPLDEAEVAGGAHGDGGVVTLEEHSVIGGLGGAVAEVLAESARRGPLRRLGLPSAFVRSGSDPGLPAMPYGLIRERVAGVGAASLACCEGGLGPPTGRRLLIPASTTAG